MWQVRGKNSKLPRETSKKLGTEEIEAQVSSLASPRAKVKAKQEIVALSPVEETPVSKMNNLVSDLVRVEEKVFGENLLEKKPSGTQSMVEPKEELEPVISSSNDFNINSNK